MKVANNWADRKHCGPGSDMAINEHKALASGFVLPKPDLKTRVDLGGSTTGKVHTPGWFTTRKG